MQQATCNCVFNSINYYEKKHLVLPKFYNLTFKENKFHSLIKINPKRLGPSLILFNIAMICKCWRIDQMDCNLDFLPTPKNFPLMLRIETLVSTCD